MNALELLALAVLALGTIGAAVMAALCWRWRREGLL